MKKRFRLEKLPIDCGQRKVLYRAISKLFESRYGKTEGPIALKHAKRVAEEVARYPELRVFRNDESIPDRLYETEPDRCCDSEGIRRCDEFALGNC